MSCTLACVVCACCWLLAVHREGFPAPLGKCLRHSLGTCSHGVLPGLLACSKCFSLPWNAGSSHGLPSQELILATVCLSLFRAELWTPARLVAFLETGKPSLNALVHSSGCRASNWWGLVGLALVGALCLAAQHAEEACSLLSAYFGPELWLVRKRRVDWLLLGPCSGEQGGDGHLWWVASTSFAGDC